MKRFALVISLLAAGCGGKNSSSPTGPSTPAATQTRIISVTGDLAFGNVNLGESATRTFTIGNSGNAVLTFTSITASTGTGSTGLSANPTSGTVQPGGSLPVSLRFAPTIAQYHSAVLNIVGDQTSGNPGINVSGFGIDNSPLFTQNGSGDNVFSIPSKVTKIRITARYTGFSSNFIVRIAGRLVVNELVGTSWNQVDFAGTYAIAGGQVEITNSSGVSWTFTEVR